VLAAGIWIDIFFRGKHLVLGGNQYKVTWVKNEINPHENIAIIIDSKKLMLLMVGNIA
jgi:hypothetical protein